MKLNWKKLTITSIAGLLVFAAATLALSQRPEGPPPGGGFRGGPGPRDGLGPIARDLNLTDNQRKDPDRIGSFACEDDVADGHCADCRPKSSTCGETASVRAWSGATAIGAP